MWSFAYHMGNHDVTSITPTHPHKRETLVTRGHVGCYNKLPYGGPLSLSIGWHVSRCSAAYILRCTILAKLPPLASKPLGPVLLDPASLSPSSYLWGTVVTLHMPTQFLWENLIAQVSVTTYLALSLFIFLLALNQNRPWAKAQKASNLAPRNLLKIGAPKLFGSYTTMPKK